MPSMATLVTFLSVTGATPSEAAWGEQELEWQVLAGARDRLQLLGIERKRYPRTSTGDDAVESARLFVG
jgi:hypothetical protein